MDESSGGRERCFAGSQPVFRMSLIVDPPWSSWTVFLVVALGTLAVVFDRLSAGDRTSSRRGSTHTARAAAGHMGRAGVSDAATALEFTRKDDQPVRLLIVADTSRSMGLPTVRRG